MRSFIEFPEDDIAIPIPAIKEIDLVHDPKSPDAPYFVTLDVGRDFKTGDCNPYFEFENEAEARVFYRKCLLKIDRFYIQKKD